MEEFFKIKKDIGGTLAKFTCTIEKRAQLCYDKVNIKEAEGVCFVGYL